MFSSQILTQNMCSCQACPAVVPIIPGSGGLKEKKRTEVNMDKYSTGADPLDIPPLEQFDAPLFKRLLWYVSQDPARFHMPGIRVWAILPRFWRLSARTCWLWMLPRRAGWTTSTRLQGA